jgi:hypothetical protein
MPINQEIGCSQNQKVKVNLDSKQKNKKEARLNS